MKKVLMVIDDDKRVRDSVYYEFEKVFKVIGASCKEEALAYYDSFRPNVILLDIEFYGFPDGWEILKEIKEKDKKVCVILMSADSAHRNNVKANEVTAFFEKPFDIDRLKNVLKENKNI